MSEKKPNPYHAFPNAGSNPDPAIDRVFWMVWVAGRGAPAKRHYDVADAIQEAKRLARKEPGLAVHLLKADGYAIAPEPPVEWHECRQA